MHNSSETVKPGRDTLMKKIKFFAALYAAKLTQFLLKLLGRNATYLPGKIASKISKDFLAHLTPPKTVIAVTGTNGKTTVSNLLTSILTDNGYLVTNNSFGSNVQAGVISALVEDSDLLGRAKKDVAVLEVDERSSLLIYPYLPPDFLICNNIMRDSIKRNAHTEFISYVIDSALPKSTKLILNADDLIASGLGSRGQQKIFFGLEAEKPEASHPQHIRDIVYCPKCGAPLESEYVRYNHIGRHRCQECDLRSPTPDYSVTGIDWELDKFTVTHCGQEETFTLINDNIVNIYNFCGVIALLSELGLSYAQISKGFTDSKIVKTRLDETAAGDLHITMLMAKGQNPIACARCYDYAAKSPLEDKGVIVIVDDLGDNIKNTETTCWLYDCDYSSLTDPSVKQIVFGGPRCKDQYLRALLAGVDKGKIRVTPESAKAAELLDTDLCKNIFVLFDLYRVKDAEAVKRTLIARRNGGALA